MSKHTIIAASHRSGTTLLSGAIKSDNAVDYAEFLRHSYEGVWRHRRFGDVKSKKLKEHELQLISEKECLKIWNVASKLYPNKNGIYKILIQQAPYTYASLWRTITCNENVRLVFIKRNPFNIHVSLINAMKNKRFHYTTENNDEIVTHSFHIYPWQLAKIFTFIEANYRFFDFICSKIPERTIQITYEDLLDNWDDTFEYVSDFLEISGLQGIGNRKYRKQLTDHKSLVSNYDELKNFFTGTQWEKYLNEQT